MQTDGQIVNHTSGAYSHAAVLAGTLGSNGHFSSSFERDGCAVRDSSADNCLRHPLEIFRRLRADGGDPDVALQVLLEYYKAVNGAAQVASGEETVVYTNRYLRRQVWQEQMAAMAAGEGYCYLHAVRYARRKRLASLLGPEPKVQQLVEALTYEDLDVENSREYFVYRVNAPGGMIDYRYHVAQECETGLLVSSLYDFLAAYLQLYRAFIATSLVFPKPVHMQVPLVGTIGASAGSFVPDCVPDEPAVTANESYDLGVTIVRDRAQVNSAANLLRAAVAGEPDGSHVLLVMLGESEGGWREPVESGRSHVSTFVTRPGVRSRFDAYMCYDVMDMSALILPTGCVLDYDGAQYGAEGVRVCAVLRGRHDFSVVTSEPEAVSCVFLSSRDYTIRKMVDKHCLGVRDTDARFVRETGATVVFRKPAVDLDVQHGVQPDIISITDPLDTWVAIWEGRSQCVGSSFYDWVTFDNPMYTCYKTFRSDVCDVEANLCGCVVLSAEGNGIVFPFGEISMQLRPTRSVHGEKMGHFDWSVRFSYVIDSYCMDNGGPSGSDFSDAL